MRTVLRGAPRFGWYCLLAWGVVPGLAAQDTVTAEDARADVLQLQSLLERVHPDPYVGFGGRVAFQRAFQEVREGLPEGAMTLPDLRNRLASLLGEMSDGHTGFGRGNAASPDVPDVYLPVRLATASDGVFISDATPDHRELMGALVLSVNGTPVDEMARRTRILFPSENISGSRRRLARGLPSLQSATDFVPDLEREIRLEVEVPEGRTSRDVVLRYELAADEWQPGPLSREDVPALSDVMGPFGRRMLADGRVGYLRINAMWSREAFETMRAAGRTDLDKWLTFAYERQLHGTAPEDTDRAIAEFPSLIEEVDDLLRDMRAAGTSNLIVDLRNNGGGFSVIGEPLLYQLFGHAYLDAPDPVYFATRVSEEYLAIQGRTLAEVREAKGWNVQMGDFLFNPPPSRPRSVMSVDDFLADQRANGFSQVARMEGGPPTGGLHVVAIADAATFSAAFDLTYHLFRMGARLVGVPPSQSPKAFTDSTPFELSRSGLAGSMSRSAVVYPGIPEREGAVVMDIPMTWERFHDFDFHPDAPLLVALAALGY